MLRAPGFRRAKRLAGVAAAAARTDGRKTRTSVAQGNVGEGGTWNPE